MTTGWRVVYENDTGDFYVFATSRVFANEQAAADYAGTVNQNRNPIVVQADAHPKPLEV